MHSAVFLDRDGVLNEALQIDGKPFPPQSIAQVIIPPEVLPSLQLLKQKNYLLCMVTNQPDVARGTQRKEVVESINDYLISKLPLDHIRVCYHDNEDNCECRKPKPGMLLDLARAHQIELSKSFMIGDRRGDMEAGMNAGCKTIFIDRGYRETKPLKYNISVQTLAEAVSFILERY